MVSITTRWMQTKCVLPVNRVTASAILSCRLRLPRCPCRCSSKARIFRSRTLAIDMSNATRVVQHRQVCAPRPDRLGILPAHHPGNLCDMTEVVRYPGGKELAQGYPTELGVAPAPIQVVRGESQRLKAAEAGRSGFGKSVQQLAEGLAS